MSQNDVENKFQELNQELIRLYQDGNYNAASKIAEQVTEIVREYYGKEHPDYATSLNNIAAMYHSMGNYTAAKSLYRQAIEIWWKTLGEEHPDYATSLNNLAELYRMMGNYGEAETLHRQAMEIRQKTLGEEHPDYAQSLNNLAELYRMMGAYSAAKSLYRQAIEIRRKTLGEVHPDYAQSLNNLAMLYDLMGNYSAAETLYQQALEIRWKTLGEEHPDYAQSLNNLATLYDSMGNYSAAEPLYRKAMRIRRKTLGEEHPDYATSLNNIAALYDLMGNYSVAETLYRQALEIRQKTLGEEHPDYAQSLNNLATLYYSMGNYSAAESLFHQSIEIRRKTLGEEHPDYATSLNNLAELYKSMGNYSAAEPLYLQAMEIWRKALGEEHPDYAGSLNNLATLYYSMGNYSAAEPLLRQAMEIRQKALGEEHPDYAGSLNNLAELYKSKGNYSAAEPLFRQAMEIRRKALGEEHPDYAGSLNNLAVLFAAQGNPDQALIFMQKASQIERKIIQQIFSIGSEGQRMEYLKSIQGNLYAYLSLVYRHYAADAHVVQEALDRILTRKAIAAEVLAVQRDAILTGKYPHLKNQLRAIQILRMQIARKTLSGPEKEGLEEHKKILSTWNVEKERLEANLARQIPEVRLEGRLGNADRTIIAHNLPPGGALVEFVCFYEFGFTAVPAQGERQWKPARYCAFVLRPDEPDAVAFLDLGEAEQIDRFIALYRQQLTGDERSLDSREETEGTRRSEERSLGLLSRFFWKKTNPKAVEKWDLGENAITAEYSEREIGLLLYSSIIKPIQKALAHCDRLILAPDGELSTIPFEVLPTEEGDRLIDHYHISYVGVGRDLLRFGVESSNNRQKPFILANPDFDLTSEKFSSMPQSTQVVSRASRDLGRKTLHFSPLPGTEIEGKNIAQMLKVRPLMEGEALEQTLKAVQSPSILHIATHGFFLENQKPDPNQKHPVFGGFGGAEMPRFSGPGFENPLLRSGLVLAGVNTWAKYGELPPEAEDGILTAEDVTGLDLIGTELVVLSACKTGIGEVMVGEGVFGLRRSFMLAGAKTLVISLWNVPDEATQELMEDFYTKILLGVSRAEALREAQLELRKRYPDPRDWGAFICQGDPGYLRAICRNPAEI